MTIEAQIRKCKAQLMYNPDLVFFSVLLANLEVQVSEDNEKVWTDGTCISVNPEFVDSLTSSELQGVLVHEALHVALGHVSVRAASSAQAMSPEKVNRACDYAINPMILDAQLQLPQGHLYNPAFRGMSWEQIYAKLPDEAEDKFTPDLVPPEGSTGGISENNEAVLAAKGKELLSQAYAVAKLAGNVPAGVEQFVKISLQPQIDWQEQLHSFVSECVNEDWSWSHVGRRSFPNIITPDLHSEQLGEGVVVIDTSSSTRSVIGKFLSEIQAIMRDVKPSRIVVMSCDSKVYNVQELSWADDLESYKVVGGGGTSFDPPFRYIEEHSMSPAFLIYLSDLFGEFPKVEPEYPVLWVSSTQQKIAPFGKTIHL